MLFAGDVKQCYLVYYSATELSEDANNFVSRFLYALKHGLLLWRNNLNFKVRVESIQQSNWTHRNKVNKQLKMGTFVHRVRNSVIS
jgi:hypothetical protein